ANPPAASAPEAMVRCAHCGIHLPRSEALLQGGRTWCSQEHARLGPAAK
ncbi:PP0621 family protein, partial [Achromobacter xylosoxidans]